MSRPFGRTPSSASPGSSRSGSRRSHWSSRWPRSSTPTPRPTRAGEAAPGQGPGRPRADRGALVPRRHGAATGDRFDLRPARGPPRTARAALPAARVGTAVRAPRRGGRDLDRACRRTSGGRGHARSRAGRRGHRGRVEPRRAGMVGDRNRNRTPTIKAHVERRGASRVPSRPANIGQFGRGPAKNVSEYPPTPRFGIELLERVE